MSPLAALPVAIALFLAAPGDKPAPPGNPAPDAPKPAQALSCQLLTQEAPRGGRIEVQGHGFGSVPLVRIDGQVTRIIERQRDRIAVMVPGDSNGGMVSVQAGRLKAQCGQLTIIGTD